MYRVLFIMMSLCSVNCYSQTYKSFYGDKMPPTGRLNTLNIFVNIIYDQTPKDDPVNDADTPMWLPGIPNSINNNPPLFLDGFMDNEYDPGQIAGSFTKRFAEASFNQLIITGDFVVVNIAQSFITPEAPGTGFTYKQLIAKCINLINNDPEGLKTIHGHNSIKDYDRMQINPSLSFRKKDTLSDGRIDMVQFFVRNCTQKHGSNNNGGKTGFEIKQPLKLNGRLCFFNAATYQGRTGGQDLSHPLYQPTEVHELAHNILGNANSAHMGGGGPVDDGDLVTLAFNKGGYSLLGSAGSSMISCNGYERWRLDYRGPTNPDFEIAANNLNSDITAADGPKTFYLRDFVTFGDAVRIKLPYLDAGAYNQYIWLENHQVHKNNKEDYPAYWTMDCKDDGVAGIYAYYQVGKDKREGSNADMLPSLTDHLIPISAEGNWDIRLLPAADIACICNIRTDIQEYFQPNPFSGYCDLENHFFNSISENIINWKQHRHEFLIKSGDGIISNKLSDMGDNADPFTGKSVIDLSSNPSIANVITYHHRNEADGTITKSTTKVDNRKIHLSGLKINMQDQTDGTYKVDVSWDSWDVENSVRWTGDIILHEKVNLLPHDTITLDQNYTPNTHIRNATTNLFSGPSYFTCLSNSSLILQSNSDFICSNFSSIVLESGSTLEISDGAILTIQSGCTLLCKSGSNIIVKGSGKINIEAGAYAGFENEAKISFVDKSSGINLQKGYLTGVNPDVNLTARCISDIPSILNFSGSGRIKTGLRKIRAGRNNR
jgi:hypothetical protein